MSIADEIRKLQALRDEGELTPEEFAKAKESLIDASANDYHLEGRVARRGDSLGEAAKLWVIAQIVLTVIALIFVVCYLCFWSPLNRIR